MGLTIILQKRKAEIVKQWFDLVVETYPEQTARLLRVQKDPFANPVGSTTRSGLAAIYDQLGQAMQTEQIRDSLDPIIRIRAVQDFTPSQATGFVFALKRILRDNLARELQAPEAVQEIVDIEARIDQIGLMAFDISVRCREQIYALQANETKNRTLKAFQRAGLLSEIPDNGPDL